MSVVIYERGGVGGERRGERRLIHQLRRPGALGRPPQAGGRLLAASPELSSSSLVLLSCVLPPPPAGLLTGWRVADSRGCFGRLRLANDAIHHAVRRRATLTATVSGFTLGGLECERDRLYRVSVEFTRLVPASVFSSRRSRPQDCPRRLRVAKCCRDRKQAKNDPRSNIQTDARTLSDRPQRRQVQVSPDLL